VCERHGGSAPQVRRRAAERLIMHADEAVELLLKWMRDPEVPHGVRAKIAQDIADRAGLAATQVHQILPSTEDPVIRFFEGIAADRIVTNTAQPDSDQPAIESHAPSGYDTPPPAVPDTEVIFDAEIIEDQPADQPAAVNGDDTPARIRQMIQDHVFDPQPTARS
jgi:hypothetical protein